MILSRICQLHVQISSRAHSMSLLHNCMMEVDASFPWRKFIRPQPLNDRPVRTTEKVSFWEIEDWRVTDQGADSGKQEDEDLNTSVSSTAKDSENTLEIEDLIQSIVQCLHMDLCQCSHQAAKQLK